MDRSQNATSAARVNKRNARTLANRKQTSLAGAANHQNQPKIIETGRRRELKAGSGKLPGGFAQESGFSRSLVRSPRSLAGVRTERKSQDLLLARPGARR